MIIYHIDKKTNIKHTLISGLLQVLVLRHILFKLFILKETEFSSFADDNTFSDAGSTTEDKISLLRDSSKKFFIWFSYGHAGNASWGICN